MCPVVFLKNFCAVLPRYQEYRTEYITTQKRAYFDLHKNEDWYVPRDFIPLIVLFRYARGTYGPVTYLSFLFVYACRLKDKYHPTNLLSVIERWSCILCGLWPCNI